MLKLNEGQWESFQRRDAQQYVSAVCNQFLDSRPDMMAQPGNAVVQGRMQAAHDDAIRIGFTSMSHIVLLMYLAADAPSFHTDPLINGHLRKPGATPEQRLDDMLALMSRKLERTD